MFFWKRGPCFPLRKSRKINCRQTVQIEPERLCASKHHFFEICQVINDFEKRLKVVLDSILLSLKKELLQTIPLNCPLLKPRISSFPTTSLRLRDALGRPEATPGGGYPEKIPGCPDRGFQDTDPEQYAILQAAFCATALRSQINRRISHS